MDKYSCVESSIDSSENEELSEDESTYSSGNHCWSEKLFCHTYHLSMNFITNNSIFNVDQLYVDENSTESPSYDTSDVDSISPGLGKFSKKSDGKHAMFSEKMVASAISGRTSFSDADNSKSNLILNDIVRNGKY